MPTYANLAQGALEQARAALHAGDPARAERHYQAALRADGNNVEILYELSMVNAHLGRFDGALALADRALAGNAGIAQLHFHRAELLGALRRPDAAVEAYRQALAIDPDHLHALNNLADSLNSMGRAAEALPLLERALALKPDYAPALNNRANALQALGRLDDALRGFDAALSAGPGNPDILSNRASVLLSLKRHEEAEADCHRALAKDPNNVGALFNLGKAQARRGEAAAALASFDAVLALRPQHAGAWCDRGGVLAALHRYKEAWACFDKALAIDPDLAEAWLASGALYSSLGQYEAALDCFRRAFVMQPNNAGAVLSLAETLRSFGRDEEAILAFEQASRIDPDLPFMPGQLAWLRLHRCNWLDIDNDIAALVAGARAGNKVSAPLDFLVMTDNADDQFACARISARAKHARTPAPVWQGERYAHRRIRLAYVSGDFRDHPVSYLIAGLLERHDRSRFEVFGYSLTEESASPLAARVRGTFEHFSVVKDVADSDIARQLREQEIDIAVDLMGPTLHSRPEIFALCPCPVQVNYLGYPGTMGADFMDYIVADPYVIPPGMERHYAEKVVRLPDTFQCNDAKRSAAPEAPSRAEAGLPQAGVVYCCFNNSAKLSPATFDLWMRVLREVPGSVLWLFADHPILQANLRKEAQARGVDPRRLVFAPVAPYPEHLARLVARRRVSRHPALQRRHHGKRCALGGRARGHPLGRGLRRAHGGEPVARDRHARADHEHAAGVRGARRAPGQRPRIPRRHQGDARREPHHQAAVRHRALPQAHRSGLPRHVGAHPARRAAGGHHGGGGFFGQVHQTMSTRSASATSISRITTHMLALILLGAGCAQLPPPCPCPQPPKPPPEARYEPASFANLPGWPQAPFAASLRAFLAVCNRPQNQVPRALLPACDEARQLPAGDDAEARAYFERVFTVFAIVAPEGATEGQVTGYYEPVIEGSRARSARYTQPVYGVPEDLVVVDLASTVPGAARACACAAG